MKYILVILIAVSIFLGAGVIQVSAYEIKGGIISVSETWGKTSPASDGIYWVQSSITVYSNAVVTIEPGVIVKFDPDTTMQIGASSNVGTLNAVGTASERIVFTSIYDDSEGGDTNTDGTTTAPSPGNWRNLYFYGAGTGSLEYCTFKYGGQLFSSRKSLVLCSSGGSPSLISNCIFRDSLYHGIDSATSGSFPSTFSDNQFIDNGEFGISLLCQDVSKIASSNTLTGNTYNAVLVKQGTLSASTHTWNKINAPYYIPLPMTISSAGILNISPGTVIKMGPGSSFFISGAGSELNLNGNATEGITVTAVIDDSVMGDTNNDGVSTGSPGYWNYFRYYNGAGGNINYSDLRYGGGNATYNAIVYVQTTGFGQLSHTRLANSLYYGFRSAASSNVPTEISNCSFENNGDYAAYLYSSDAHVIQSNNTFSNNARQAVRLDSSTLPGGSYTWNSLTVAYSLMGSTQINAGTTLNISPGTILKFDSNADIYNRGTLNAYGTADDRIIFTSLQDNSNGGDSNGADPNNPAAGDWEYLYFRYAGTGVLQYCDMLYAGQNGTNTAAIYCADGGTPTEISNSRFQNSAGYGLLCRANSAPTTINNCDFSDNAYSPISCDVIGATAISSNNTFTDNFSQSIHILGQNLNPSVPTTYTWNKLSIPLWIQSSVTINTDATFQPGAGNILKMQPATQIFVSGIFDCDGTPADPVVITSIYDDTFGGDSNADGAATAPNPGDWTNIYFYTNGGGFIDNSIIRYGGYSNGNQIWCRYSTPTQISNSQIGYSAEYGLYCESGFTPGLIDNNTFHDNLHYPLRLMASEVPAIQSNNIFTNNHYQVVEVGGDTITAASATTVNWNKVTIPLLITSSITVGQNVTFNPGPGNILKMASAQSIIVNNGNFQCIGTASDPIYITSVLDDAAGGDSNADGTATVPSPGNWGYIYFYTGGMGDLAYTTIRYAGSGSGCGIWARYSSPATISHCTVRDVTNIGIHLSSPSADPTITNSLIRDNQRGIVVASGGADATIGHTSGLGNDIYANSVYGVENLGSNCIAARYNYWGDNSGPHDPSTTTDNCTLAGNAGSGDNVTDNVDYIGFIGSPLQPPDPPTLLSPASPSEVSLTTPQLTVTNSISSGTLRYIFHLSTNDTFTPILQQGDIATGVGTTSWTVPSGLNENTVYYWRCRAEDQDSTLPSSWTETGRFFVNAVNNPPNVPSLNSPAYNSQQFTLTPTLICNNTTDQDDNEAMDYPLNYEFAVYDDIDCTNQVAGTAGVAEGAGTTSYTLVTTLTENGEYWWRVRANDGTLNGNWSSKRKFYVTAINEAPGAPTLSAPAEGSTVTTNPVVLWINNADDPDHDPTLTYSFYVFDESAMITPVASTTKVSGGCCSGVSGWSVLPALEYSRWYWWTSNATDAEYTSPDMSTATFFSQGFPMPEINEYGNLPTLSGDENRGDKIVYSFPASTGDIDLVFQVFNVETGMESDYRIEINGTDIGSQGSACDATWSDSRIITLPDVYVNDGIGNIITFINQQNSREAYITEWGLRNVGINIPVPETVWLWEFNTAIDVMWTDVPDVMGYNVYRSDLTGGPYAKINADRVTGHVFHDTGLTNGQTYFYIIRSVDAHLFESFNSMEIYGTPVSSIVTPVTSLIVYRNGTDIILEWLGVGTSAGVLQYNIYNHDPQSSPTFRRDDASLLGMPGTSPFTVTDGMTDGLIYYFDVATEDNNNDEADYFERDN